MKKGFAITLLVFMVLALVGCSNYRSSYSAIGLVRSNTSHRAYLNFHILKGSLVYDLKVNGSEDMICTGKLEEGSLTVYYDVGGSKEELVQLSGGQTFDIVMDDLKAGKVIIIVETDGKCKDGRLEFEVKGRENK